VNDQPTEAEQLVSLARMAGHNPQMPEPGLQRDMLRLQLAGEALAQGATWAQIGRAMGYGGPKVTKAALKRLQRRIRREALKTEA
jgi:hypothetical protein